MAVKSREWNGNTACGTDRRSALRNELCERGSCRAVGALRHAPEKYGHVDRRTLATKRSLQWEREKSRGAHETPPRSGDRPITTTHVGLRGWSPFASQPVWNTAWHAFPTHREAAAQSHKLSHECLQERRANDGRKGRVTVAACGTGRICCSGAIPPRPLHRLVVNVARGASTAWLYGVAVRRTCNFRVTK